jgi:hypothetical protein
MDELKRGIALLSLIDREGALKNRRFVAVKIMFIGRWLKCFLLQDICFLIGRGGAFYQWGRLILPL